MPLKESNPGPYKPRTPDPIPPNPVGKEIEDKLALRNSLEEGNFAIVNWNKDGNGQQPKTLCFTSGTILNVK